MQAIDRGDQKASIQLVRDSLHQLKLSTASAEIHKEEVLLNELLDLVTDNRVDLARKVMGTQAFMRSRGGKVRNQEGRDEF